MTAKNTNTYRWVGLGFTVAGFVNPLLWMAYRKEWEFAGASSPADMAGGTLVVTAVAVFVSWLAQRVA